MSAGNEPSSGLTLHASNRLEILARELARTLLPPLEDPFRKEIIVVQSRGMEKWVRMELARHHRICANVWFPFPNSLMEFLFDLVCPDLPPSPLYGRDHLIWLVMKHMVRCLKGPDFEPVRSYLGETPRPLKLFQLSERVAYLFDQYLVFRPDMILRWEKGRSSHWQARLWTSLRKEVPATHKAALRSLFLKRMADPAHAPGGLPERVSVFGISTLPPFHLEILSALSRHIPVHLFFMNPCREYWGDIVSGKEEARILVHREKRGSGDLHLLRGNSLLASMGGLGREFFSVLLDLETTGQDLFDHPGEESLLQAIQSDILLLREPGYAGHPPRTVKASDDSIQVHSCHSPMREVEVLRDRLLDLFEKYPGLEPRDILVMAPDIEVYAPYVHAVFGLRDDRIPAIPFSIADRSPVREGGLPEAFLSFLELPKGRFEAASVLSFLEYPAVRDRFGIAARDLHVIRRWIREARIAWGMDEKDREAHGLPPLRENTWRFGLERLLLGFALPDEETLFQGIVPMDRVEGQEASLLGKFAHFVETAHQATTRLKAPKSAAEWARALEDLLEDFFFIEGTEAYHARRLRAAWEALSRAETLCGFVEALDLDTVTAFVRRRIEEKVPARGFLTGGVTFCSMLPMRSIPFKVICILGMDHEAYPRKTERLEFDLMADAPRPGDRSRRKDDRYLFLEALLSARRVFYVSYVGQNTRDNGSAPPSVLVSELLDYISQGFAPEAGPQDTVLDQILIRHRLQPFSPAYFDPARTELFSYSAQDLEAARRLLEYRVEDRPFMERALDRPGPEWREVPLARLLRFFSNPARFFLRERLGVSLGGPEKALLNTEPFVVHGLDRYLLCQKLLEWKLAGKDLAGAYPLVRGMGLLPHGAGGECAYEEIRLGVEDFAMRLRKTVGAESSWEMELDETLEGFHLTGKVSELYGTALVHYRQARAKGRDHLLLWLRHLALTCGDTPQITQSILLTRDGCWTYGVLPGARKLLAAYLELYLEGLRRPLPFFPESSYSFARELLVERKGESGAIEKAATAWRGDQYRRAESDEPHYQTCFGNVDPLGETFQELALKVYGPLLEIQKKIG
ncbi:MAG: exodeoxyribonuclease V subunit gamma [Deltaproteobacteria bacterium]|nr:MAG: exodeoxyribonuclease V subunit gamma [Deltaproteobacteria bacterium]